MDKKTSSEQVAISARSIWGKLIATLRQENFMTLHTACGEIRDVTLKDNILTVFVKEEYLYNILVKPENFSKISLLIKKQKTDLEVKIILKSKEVNKATENLQKLKSVFGDFVEE